MLENKAITYLKHFTTIGASTIFNMLLSLLLTPILTRLIDTASFGEFSVYSIYVNVGMFVFSMGMDQAMSRFFFENDSWDYKHVLVVKCLKIPLTLLMILGLCLILLKSMTKILSAYSWLYMFLLWIGIITQVLYRIGLILVRLRLDTKKYSIITVVYKALYIVIALVLIALISDHHFELLAIATIISTILATLIAMLSEKRFWHPIHNKNMLQMVDTAALIRYGAPFIVSLGVAAFFSAVDRLCLKIYCDMNDVGIYASATTIMGIFGVITTTFNSLWGPISIEHYAKSPNDYSFHKKGCDMIAVVMFLFGLTFILCVDLVGLLLGNDYREAVRLLPFLAFYPILNTISEVTVRGIDFEKKSQYHMLISVVCLLASFAFNMVLIPVLGIRGAAISNAASYLVFFMMRSQISIHCYPVGYKLWKIYLMFAISAVFALHRSYFRFSWIDIALYVSIVTILMILYRDTLDSIIEYVKAILLSLRKK